MAWSTSGVQVLYYLKPSMLKLILSVLGFSGRVILPLLGDLGLHGQIFVSLNPKEVWVSDFYKILKLCLGSRGYGTSSQTHDPFGLLGYRAIISDV